MRHFVTFLPLWGNSDLRATARHRYKRVSTCVALASRNFYQQNAHGEHFIHSDAVDGDGQEDYLLNSATSFI